MAIVDPFTLVWEAVRARLATVFPTTGAAEAWQIELVPDPMSHGEFAALAQRCPFVAVSWRQFAPAANSGRIVEGKLGMRVTIVTKNSRGRAHRFTGDNRGVGLFQAMTAALYVLQGLDIPEVGTLGVTACAQAYAEGYNDANAAVATIDIEVHTSFKDALGETDALPAFQRLFSSITGNGLDDGIVQDPVELPLATTSP